MTEIRDLNSFLLGGNQTCNPSTPISVKDPSVMVEITIPVYKTGVLPLKLTRIICGEYQI